MKLPPIRTTSDNPKDIVRCINELVQRINSLQINESNTLIVDQQLNGVNIEVRQKPGGATNSDARWS